MRDNSWIIHTNVHHPKQYPLRREINYIGLPDFSACNIKNTGSLDTKLTCIDLLQALSLAIILLFTNMVEFPTKVTRRA